jgi:hypothetical protein
LSGGQVGWVKEKTLFFIVLGYKKKRDLKTTGEGEERKKRVKYISQGEGNRYTVCKVVGGGRVFH